jgi:hypothetical protein
MSTTFVVRCAKSQSDVRKGAWVRDLNACADRVSETKNAKKEWDLAQAQVKQVDKWYV